MAAAGCGYFGVESASSAAAATPPKAAAPPADANSFEGFSILLSIPFTGPDHVRQATESKRKTEAATGWKGIYLVHEADRSCMYLGRYANEAEAGRELPKVRAWKSSLDTTPFAAAIVVKRSTGRVGPPEWDLANVDDANLPCTVVVGQYHNVPEERYLNRKEMAVEACRELRAKGELAFYYHGPEQSLVTIGLFGPTPYRVETADQVRLPIPQDAGIRKVMDAHPKLAVNGYEAFRIVRDPKTGQPILDPKTRQPLRVYDPSYVTAIAEIRRGASALPAGGLGQPQPR